MKRKRRKVELGFATSDRVLPQTIELNKRDTTFSKVFSLHTFVDLLFCATIVLLIVEMKQQRLFGILYLVHRCTFCTLCTPVKIDVSLFPLNWMCGHHILECGDHIPFLPCSGHWIQSVDIWVQMKSFSLCWSFKSIKYNSSMEIVLRVYSLHASYMLYTCSFISQ